MQIRAGKHETRIACVGTGYFSGFHFDAWNRLENADVVGALSLNADQAAATGFPPFTDLKTMLDETRPDILDIITPPPSHLELIRISLANGVRTIICQKPFCASLEEAKEAVRLADEAKANLIVHENFRFQPWYRRMRMALDDGMIGKVHQATFRMRTGDGQGDHAYLDRQPYFQTMPKFLLHETGVHWFDTFRYLLGDPIAVYADLRKMNPVIAGEDAGHVLMDFENGVRALFDGNRHLDHAANDRRLTFGEGLIEGGEGCLELLGDGGVYLRRFGQQSAETLLAPQAWPGFAGDCVHALCAHVLEALATGSKFENSAEEYLRVLQMEAAAYQSAAEGRKIYL